MIFDDHSLFTANLQAKLDKHLFDDLYASFGIQDQDQSFRFIYLVRYFHFLPCMCTCLSTIDFFGDHLLGWSQGPLRIWRHDALVNIVYNVLAKDHPGVLKEQRISYDDGSHPGDVFQPDYQHGHPAYFDISVQSTTQLSFVSSSASRAGVAAGEVAKDEKYLAAVERLFPCSCRNIWSMDTLCPENFVYYCWPYHPT